MVKLGRRAARVQFNAALLGALGMPLVFLARGHGVACLLPLAIAPLAWRHARQLRERRSPGELIALLGATGRLLALYALLFSAGLAG